MLAYLLLLFVPGGLLLMFCSLNSKQKNYIALSAFFVILYGMLACQSVNGGVDLPHYQYYFQIFKVMPWNKLAEYDLELGFIVYTKIIGLFTDNFQIYLAITYFIILWPIASLYFKNPDNSFLEIVLFVNMSTFMMLFSGVRQMMSISIGFLAYHQVVNKKPIRFLILVFLARLFHASAIILFLMYPFYHLRISQRMAIVVIPSLVLVFMLNKVIFRLIGLGIQFLGLKYDATIQSTGAYTTIVLFFIFYIFSLVFLDEKMADKQTLGLRNLLLVTLVIQMFAPLHALVSRMGYYYLFLIPLLMAKVLKYTKQQFRHLIPIVQMVMCSFFAVYFIYEMYCGNDQLQIFPYIPYWKG